MDNRRLPSEGNPGNKGPWSSHGSDFHHFPTSTVLAGNPASRPCHFRSSSLRPALFFHFTLDPVLCLSFRGEAYHTCDADFDGTAGSHLSPVPSIRGMKLNTDCFRANIRVLSARELVGGPWIADRRRLCSAECSEGVRSRHVLVE